MAEHKVTPKASEIPSDAAVQVFVGETAIALVRCNGQVCAVADVCTHEHAYLSEGFVEEGTIECPLHGSMFDLNTGEARTLPATEPIATYAVRVDGDDVYVEVP